LSPADLRTFARWIERSGPYQLLDAIDRLRHTADDTQRAVRPSAAGPDYGAPIAKSAGLTARIEQLLLGEAGLTRTQAADLLRSELRQETGLFDDIPVLGKISFRDWVERVTERIPESVLLHVVTRLRNKLVHSEKPDWPLRKTQD